MEGVSVSEEYKIATTEVLSILEYLPRSEVDKIPNTFKEFLKENSLSDYKTNFDYSLGLDKIELKHKTKLLLAMIYRDYICSEEERLEYNKILYQNEETYQKHLREKYNPNDIFKKQKEITVELSENNSNVTLIEYKENFFIKLRNFVFKILHNF